MGREAITFTIPAVPEWTIWLVASVIIAILWWRIGRWALTRYLFSDLIVRTWMEVALAIACGPSGWRFLHSYLGGSPDPPEGQE